MGGGALFADGQLIAWGARGAVMVTAADTSRSLFAQLDISDLTGIVTDGAWSVVAASRQAVTLLGAHGSVVSVASVPTEWGSVSRGAPALAPGRVYVTTSSGQVLALGE